MIIDDRDLGKEAFVDRHRHTLRRHYAQDGRQVDDSKTKQLAADLWAYLQYLMDYTRRFGAQDPQSNW